MCARQDRLRVDEFLPKLADPGNLADEFFPGFQETRRSHAYPNAGGGSAEDDVAGQQGGDPGKALDQGRHIENKISGAAVLYGFAVDRTLQLDVVRIGEFVDRNYPRANRGESGEGFAGLNCGAGPDSWMTRSEMSCPAVSPAM